MGEVIPFRRGEGHSDPGEGLLVQIRRALVETGSASQPIVGLTVSVQEWRRLARVAGRELKRPVRTVVSVDAVHAGLADWPCDERETVITRDAMRRAVQSMTWL